MTERAKDLQNDPFRAGILKIMLDHVADRTGHGFRSAIASEVRTYSQQIDDQQEVSQLFLKICDLLLDCNSKNLPDNSFKVAIANMIHENSGSKTPLDDEIRKLTGFSTLELSQAGEALKDLECLSSVFRNSQIMK